MAFPTATLRNPAVALEGMAADNNELDVASRFAANATVAPGRFVVFHAGDADDQIRAPVSSAECTSNQAQGVTMLDVTALNNPYAVGDPCPVVVEGEMWVLTEEAVTPASDVYVRFTDNSGTYTPGVIGSFRASADSGKAVAVPGLRFMTSTTGAGLVRLSVKMLGNAKGATGATGATGPTGPTGPTA